MCSKSFKQITKIIDNNDIARFNIGEITSNDRKLVINYTYKSILTIEKRTVMFVY